MFIKVHRALLGEKNVCSIPLDECKDKFTNVALCEKLLNAVSESPSGEKNEVRGLDEALKKMTSGDAMEVQRKHGHPYTAIPIARMVFAANEKPYFSDRSTGLWDRLRVFLFNQVIRGSDMQNPYLDKEIIEEELSGVLLWALEGLMKLKNHKVFPQSVHCREFVERYRAMCNPTSVFLHETVRSHPGSSIGRQELYNCYKQWCDDNGIKYTSAIKFNESVERELNVRHCRLFDEFGGKIHSWSGIEFQEQC